jgi:uncharacterized protein YjiS (DUF1127 family)
MAPRIRALRRFVSFPANRRELDELSWLIDYHQLRDAGSPHISRSAIIRMAIHRFYRELNHAKTRKPAARLP